MNNFENYLQSLFPKDDLINKAMKYTLLDQGKRFRPRLMFALLADYGIDLEEGYPYAAAIEMIHNYSLIHDDLPAMDNDDYRRGRLTNHKVFGEDMAILAGDALLTRSFELLSTCENEHLGKIINEYALAAGDKGMILGQVIDLKLSENANPTYQDLVEMDKNKTGRLIALPLVIAGYLANDLENIETLREIGLNLGIAYQIQDDLLDYTENNEVKSSDEINGKVTYITLLGKDGALKELDILFTKTENLLNKLEKHDSLSKLIEVIKTRKK